LKKEVGSGSISQRCGTGQKCQGSPRLVARVVWMVPGTGEWHTATIWRARKNGSLAINGGQPVLGFSSGIFQVHRTQFMQFTKDTRSHVYYVQFKQHMFTYNNQSIVTHLSGSVADPDPDPIVRGTDPALDSAPDPSIIKQKYSSKKTLILLLCDFFIVNIASKSTEVRIRGSGSGSLPKCHRSATLLSGDRTYK
jgi:hypothetical protein